VILKLRERGIGSQAYFPAIHCQPYMQQYEFAVPFPLPFTEAASDNCLAVPMFAGASAEEIEYVCSGLRQALDSMGTAIWSQPTSVAV
jgi:dTDP-4-amino-4,6-dideoxygalactose transaminase